MSFQRNFAQVNAFQTEGVGSAPPVVQQFFSGGWEPRPKRKTKEEVRREREEWGILPKKAKELIIRVAAQHVEEPDNTEAIVAAFERAELAYKEKYAILYRREVERQLELMREDEEFLMLH